MQNKKPNEWSGDSPVCIIKIKGKTNVPKEQNFHCGNNNAQLCLCKTILTRSPFEEAKMKKLLSVVLYFFILHKHLDAKSGNLRTSDAKNEQVEKKNFSNGWVPYYLPQKGQTTPIALLAALPEKTIFRKSDNMRKDMKEEEEEEEEGGEENVSSLIQSGEENDGDFQFRLQIVEGAEDSTDTELEGEGSSPADAVHMEVPTGEVDNLEKGEALLEQVEVHTAEHAAELVAEPVEEEPMEEEPVAAPVDEEPQAADDENGEAPEEAQSLPVQEADEVSVEEGQEGTPSVAEQTVDESVPSEPEDVAVPSEPADAAVPNEPEDAAVPSQPVDESVPSEPADAALPEPNESNGSEVDTEEEESGKENFYHLEEDEEEEEEEEEFEDDYDNVMHKINEHEGETPSNDGPKNLNRADIITMLAVRNMLSALNYDYAVMDFLTGFNPDVISSIYVF
ncbi:hypothetical protein PCYB_063010 [Plasmodium cynomolgi strain B]|uniref:Uncharacterized protein n=1 Tax=Plasmodium cynomolgi (strain B) TaxID=1120755 RepID=K6UR87_PLACD|nr:hypothetical protein PCYB_063010 [Plasmodium cynomolgi strain B]GAB65569.1 hypothetical protein PCYB_063010 [Plasmodium cynomolgi strain B]